MAGTLIRGEMAPEECRSEYSNIRLTSPLFLDPIPRLPGILIHWS